MGAGVLCFATKCVSLNTLSPIPPCPLLPPRRGFAGSLPALFSEGLLVDNEHCEHMRLAAEKHCSFETLEPLSTPNHLAAATPMAVLPLGLSGGDGSSGAANRHGHTQAAVEAINNDNAAVAGSSSVPSGTAAQAVSPSAITTTMQADGGAVEAGRDWSGSMSGLAPAAANDSLSLLQEVRQQLGRAALRQRRHARNSVLAGPSFSSTLAEVLVASGMVRMM